MSKTFDAIDDDLAAWIAAQRMFFVATAPLAADGHVNVSPKGLDSFAVLGPREVAYLDLTGSGVETIAHLRENGRITLLFCAFAGPPRLLRLYGRGVAVEPGDAEFAALAQRFPAHPGVRAVVRVALGRIADSCGYGVPVYRFERDRDQLPAWAERKGPDGVREYRAERNAASIDGLPGVRAES
ncbi:MAG: pyridoxamine 5'-phosphate oxidase [Proteobacteria bacterium]|nr:MAG: pyridoxamine 5'-phosphate oxidase [Pseudomonadota bacterium]